jgi:hypothetical protein
MVDIFDNGVPKYQSPQAIYDGLCELEQSEEINILTEMFPDVSYERQGYYYQDNGSRLKEKFEEFTDYGSNMWPMEVALWQMSGVKEYSYISYPDVHDLVFEVLVNSDFAKRIGFKKLFVETMLGDYDPNRKSKVIIEDCAEEIRELNRFDFTRIANTLYKVLSTHESLQYTMWNPNVVHSRYNDFCNKFHDKLRRMDVRAEAALITECRSMLTAYDDFIHGLRVTQALHEYLEKTYGARLAKLQSQYDQRTAGLLMAAEKHGLLDAIKADIDLAVPEVPLLMDLSHVNGLQGLAAHETTE